MNDNIQPIGDTAFEVIPEVECIIPELKTELDSIIDQQIKSVTQNIILDAMNKTKVSKRMIDFTKRVVLNAQTLAYSRGYTRIAIDVITSAAILLDLYSVRYKNLHIFMIRLNHQEELKKLDPAIAENICSMIEGHHGYDSIVPKIASKEGTIEQILTDAVALASHNKV